MPFIFPQATTNLGYLEEGGLQGPSQHFSFEGPETNLPGMF